MQKASLCGHTHQAHNLTHCHLGPILSECSKFLTLTRKKSLNILAAMPG